MSEPAPGFASPNYTQTPNDFYDVHLREMGLAEVKVVSAVMRLTFGYHRNRAHASLNYLKTVTGLSEGGVLIGAEAGERRGLIRRVNKGNGRRQVLLWEVIVRGPATSAGEVVTDPATSAGEVVLPQTVRQSTSVREVLLNKDKQTENKTTSSAPAPAPNPAPAAAAVVGVWTVDGFIEWARLAKAKAAKLRAAECEPARFVASYLYGLVQKGIKYPASWAASDAIDNPRGAMRRPYSQLAALGPAGLAVVLAWLRGGPPPPDIAMAPALVYRGELLQRHKDDGEGLAVAVGVALAELGLADLVPEPEPEPEPRAPAPRPAPGAWEEFVNQMGREVSKGTKQALATIQAELIEASEGGQTFKIQSEHDYQWLKSRIAARAKKDYRVLFVKG